MRKDLKTLKRLRKEDRLTPNELKHWKSLPLLALPEKGDANDKRLGRLITDEIPELPHLPILDEFPFHEFILSDRGLTVGKIKVTEDEQNKKLILSAQWYFVSVFDYPIPVSCDHVYDYVAQKEYIVNSKMAGISLDDDSVWVGSIKEDAEVWLMGIVHTLFAMIRFAEEHDLYPILEKKQTKARPGKKKGGGLNQTR